MPSRRELAILAAIFIVAALVFSLAPGIDLLIASQFYTPGQGFPAEKNPLVEAIYWFVWGASRAAVAGVLLLWIASLIARRGWLLQRRRWFGFLLLAFILGPGLITDVGLKNHWGRARPHQIREFGGERQFSPALVIADQCERNCSFVSGHVTGAAAIMSFGWLAARRRRNRWLVASALAAAGVGLVRIMQGGHFASDVLFAFYAVWIGNWIAGWILGRAGLLPGAEGLPRLLR